MIRSASHSVIPFSARAIRLTDTMIPTAIRLLDLSSMNWTPSLGTHALDATSGHERKDGAPPRRGRLGAVMGAGHTTGTPARMEKKPAGWSPRTPTRLADGLGAEGCPVAYRDSPRNVGSPVLPASREIRRSTASGIRRLHFSDLSGSSSRGRLILSRRGSAQTDGPGVVSGKPKVFMSSPPSGPRPARRRTGGAGPRRRPLR